MTEQTRIAGCLLGGAIGDALGHAYEGKQAPIEFDPEAPLKISDETQLTLATCEALTAAGRVDPERIAAQFLHWFKKRRITGLGSSTLKALRDLEAGAHWALAGASGERAAGNGAAMRIAPLAFLLDPTSQKGRTQIRDVSNITHKNDAAYVGAVAVALAIWMSASNDVPMETLPGAIAEEIPDSLVRDRLLKLEKIPAQAKPVELVEEFGNTGFVAESVPLAIHAARNVDALGFHETLVAAIQAGGDTDTIGSMTGQIAGARVGEENIATEILNKLPERDLIRKIVGEFSTSSAVTA